MGYHDRMPGTLDGIRDYYRQRGYQEDPPLETKEPGQVASFAKPLPDGSRLHVRVKQGRKRYTIDSHKDSADPNKDPIGHIQDIVFSPVHKKRTVTRKDIGTGN